MRIEQSTNDRGESVLTAAIPIPEGVDPEWFAQYLERALSHEITLLLSHVDVELEDAADGFAEGA